MALIEAVKRGDKKKVERILIEGKENVNGQDELYGCTAFIWAAGRGHKEICEMIISKGCNVDMQNTDTALMIVCENNRTDVVRMLLCQKSNNSA